MWWRLATGDWRVLIQIWRQKAQLIERDIIGPTRQVQSAGAGNRCGYDGASVIRSGETSTKGNQRGSVSLKVVVSHRTQLKANLLKRRLASVGEAKESCLQLWEALECSICDPLVGIQPGPPVICASLCDRVFQSCGDAYFSMDSKTRFLAPCGVNDFLCGRAGEWVSNGTDFCTALGFSVEVAEHSYRAANQASCYGGKRSLDHIADSWTQPEIHQRPVSSRWSEGFQLRVLEMSFSEKVSWAVGGMVLTAGLLFVSKRKSYSRRQKLAAIQRAARRLDGKMNQSDVQGKRRGNLR
ncbi:unnamed protein product [Linum tenue]|uniref:Folate receptor-like domain-containing protein n=1 Tax=Linum tenue TaxID=586396 RepID=A0AAV0J6R5_9ROSI|nr:unnamed protein product [Linum tenue]